jgi:hypothetical protein
VRAGQECESFFPTNHKDSTFRFSARIQVFTGRSRALIHRSRRNASGFNKNVKKNLRRPQGCPILAQAIA